MPKTLPLKSGQTEIENTNVLISKDDLSFSINLAPAIATGYAAPTPCGKIVKEFGKFIHVKLNTIDYNKNLYVLKDYIMETSAANKKGGDIFISALKDLEGETNATNTLLIKKDDIDYCGLPTPISKGKTTFKAAPGSEALEGVSTITFSDLVTGNGKNLEQFYTIIQNIEGVESNGFAK